MIRYEDALAQAHSDAASYHTALTAAQARIRDLEATLARQAALEAYARWTFEAAVLEGCNIEGSDVQDKLLALGLTEERLPEPGSPEAEEWGEDQPLHYWRESPDLAPWRALVEAAGTLADKYDQTCAALHMTASLSRGEPETVRRAREEQNAAMLDVIARARACGLGVKT